ncbi:type II toxin-antitoxin system RelE/ParE family toxin [Agrobacterium tumefaciens]|uniref:type II toxin-antitoxin system RelE/ParE family toxin n=1 Tax=Agrobacterium tumefaciens TaxID=358 RepID=UPI00287CEB68|nr:type II toxin-antitoxin system RelE/ParE family toxin [Agrobacterium tumefaciens]MDS7596422.1 type II toxin-antitoxin system RelE/ParE family toxin [Agrobacterium tumefaciens]
MSYTLRNTAEAVEDFDRIYDYIVIYNIETAERAITALRSGLNMLVEFPFSCRRAQGGTSLMPELLIPFGSSGYIVLFRIDGPETVTIAAARHHREDDYH